MPGRRDAGAAAQHVLADHELAVVFADARRGRRGSPDRAGRRSCVHSHTSPNICAGRAVARRRGAGSGRSALVPSVVAARRAAGARRLPFELGRQALAGPVREGVGLEVADVADGRARIDRQQPVERHLVPGAVALLPVAGRCPALRVDRRPAVGEPEQRRRVAAVLHEGQPFAIGDAAGRPGDRDSSSTSWRGPSLS